MFLRTMFYWIIVTNCTERNARHMCSAKLRVHMDLYFFTFVLSCVGSGLATGWSPAEGVLPTLYKIKDTEVKQSVSQMSYAPDGATRITITDFISICDEVFFPLVTFLSWVLAMLWLLFKARSIGPYRLFSFAYLRIFWRALEGVIYLFYMPF
jgi:hypothetical protein